MSTARLVNGVANSTTQRDRDQLDQSVAVLLQQFLQARCVSLLQLVEKEGVRQLALKVQACSPGAESTIATHPARMDLLGIVDTWHASASMNQWMESPGNDGQILTLFPLPSRNDMLTLLAVESDASLPVPQIDMVYGILRIVENHLTMLDYGERDTLTGLLNRKTFEAQFEKLRRRPAPAANGNNLPAEPCWLALVDVDRFKSINDSHGHLFGDEVLLLVSQVMKRTFRGSDQLFRFGGEEFLILLDQTSATGVGIALERLRAAIASFNFPQVGSVTISIGYTRVDSNDVPTTCVERADEALYYAKNHGRNNVQFHEALVEAGELKSKATKSGEVELF
jgi:diguanylate cyclase (GGDEF)-like protein